jgi:hypothetical protein
MAEGAVVQDLMEADIKELRGKLVGRGSWFRITAGADHRKLEWRAVLDFPNHALACEARSADLVVIGQTRGPGDAYSALDPGGAVLKIGRPTLIVPDGVDALRAEHVVIGWKDSREARRAVQDAIPFLQMIFSCLSRKPEIASSSGSRRTPSRVSSTSAKLSCRPPTAPRLSSSCALRHSYARASTRPGSHQQVLQGAPVLNRAAHPTSSSGT